MTKPKPETATSAPTRYVILVEDENPDVPAGHWHQMGTTEATSAEGACRKFADDLDLEEATLVAVPARAFTNALRLATTKNRQYTRRDLSTRGATAAAAPAAAPKDDIDPEDIPF